jgi:hypothetical protein
VLKKDDFAQSGKAFNTVTISGGSGFLPPGKDGKMLNPALTSSKNRFLDKMAALLSDLCTEPFENLPLQACTKL